MSLTRDELIYMSRIAEQTERFEDMLEYMKKVVELKSELNVEERNLLSVSYKNSVGSRRYFNSKKNCMESAFFYRTKGGEQGKQKPKNFKRL
jgi:hypothetical protein